MRKFHPPNRQLMNCVLVVSFILTACTAAKPTPTPTPIPPTATPIPPTNTPLPPTPTVQPTVAYVPSAKGYSEAPMLKEMVIASVIPPIDQRLPEKPFVVGPGVYLTAENLPDWQPGKYGGALRTISTDTGFNADVFTALNEPFLMAPKIGDQGIVCNVCQEYTVSQDNKVFTFVLRKGLKWSDGHPVTTEDVRFAWEVIRKDKILYPDGPENTFHTGYSPNGSLAQFEFIDDYTFKVSFDAPYGGFLHALAIHNWTGYTDILEPAHYLKKFSNVGDMRCTNWNVYDVNCYGYPTLSPWINQYKNTRRWERNPYYFKVDTLGQQLPYIDAITTQTADSPEMVSQKAAQGEVDFWGDGGLMSLTRFLNLEPCSVYMCFGDVGLVNLALFQQNEAKGGYRVQLLDTHYDPIDLFIYTTGGDSNWQQLAQDVRFRQAVSLAINRQEIIDTVYAGYAALPLKTVGAEYSQFDVARANALLDEIGLTHKDAEGYRQYADGKTVEIQIYSDIAYTPDAIQAANLTAQYLTAIGIKVTTGGDWSIYVQAQVLAGNDQGWDSAMDMINNYGSLDWARWEISKGKQGKEPPQYMKDILKIDAEKWAELPGTEAYNQKVEAVYQWRRDNLPVITIVEGGKSLLIVNKTLKNVPSAGYAIAAGFSIVQMYFDAP